MPDVKRPEHGVAGLSVRRLTHGNEFLGGTRRIYPSFQKLHRVEPD